MGQIVVVAALLLICFIEEVKSDASDHRYKVGESVPFYANKIGPFSNPSVTYSYYDLPFCSPGFFLCQNLLFFCLYLIEHIIVTKCNNGLDQMADPVKEKKLTLGETLNGDRLISGPYKLDFLVGNDSKVLCRKRLTKEEVSKFRYAVMADYYIQLYYDDLPIWAFIGKVERNWDQTEQKLDQSKSKCYIFTHLEFEILYNGDRVIEVNARTNAQSLADVTEDKEVDVEFRYTVKWKKTRTLYEERMERYSLSSSLPHHMEIHWFSMVNSCVTVVFLVGCIVIFYFRVLKKDITKYLDAEELAEEHEVTGWKSLHGDVFRYPNNKCLLAAALGCGTQLITLVVFILILGIAGVFYPYNRGRLLTAFIYLYAFTSGVAGYTSVSFYRQLEGTNWVKNLLLTGSLFSGPFFLTFCFLNSVAVSYKATAALPFSKLLVICLIWTFVAIPMLLFGGFAGKNSKVEFQAPCPTTKLPREVPSQRWYKGIIPQIVFGGVLPFSAVNVELYYLFASIWGHRIYTIYLILCIVFVFVLLVTALGCMALTYLQLAGENHQWWWRSFLVGGSTGFFIYCYCLYYFFERSDMSGFMQISFFFGYMACICYGVFLMLGTVGFHVSLLLVRYIYGSIKSD